MNDPNNPNKVPHVPNNLPLAEGMPLPPHRKSSLPDTYVMGLSHQDLLTEMSRLLSGKKAQGAWWRHIFNEILYRRLAMYKSISCEVIRETNWVYETYEVLEKVFGIPLTKESWTVMMDLKDGYTLPEI
jgi:hypothetical protein